MPENMRILVVDDSEISRRLLQQALIDGGYTDINFAKSGAEALTLLGVTPFSNDPKLPPPNAILLDVVMSGMDGIETCARIRADVRYRYTPILVVTSDKEMNTMAQVFVAGASDYVRKPFEQVELLSRLRSSMRLASEIDRRLAREHELHHVQRAGAANLAPPPHPRTLEHSPEALHAAGADSVNPITGLPGVRMLETLLVAQTTHRAETLGVLALQIDGFKTHRSGAMAPEDTALLKRVVTALQVLPARLGDTLAHLEGGIFVALVHCPNVDDFAKRAEMIRQGIVNHAVPYRDDHAGKTVTLSIGAARCTRKKAPDARSLLTSAIAAMEQAAAEGGNHVVFLS